MDQCGGAPAAAIAKFLSAENGFIVGASRFNQTKATLYGLSAATGAGLWRMALGGSGLVAGSGTFANCTDAACTVYSAATGKVERTLPLSGAITKVQPTPVALSAHYLMVSDQPVGVSHATCVFGIGSGTRSTCYALPTASATYDLLGGAWTYGETGDLAWHWPAG